MKIFSKILLILILSVGVFSLNVNADFLDIFGWGSPAVNIKCQDSAWNAIDCNIKNWVEIVKWEVNWIEKTDSLSVYIQKVVAYILTFVSIIAVVYIIYAWFRILISAWDEETLKKQKSTILYIVIGIAIMWLAYPITIFIISLFS
jgi:hypothetical protein